MTANVKELQNENSHLEEEACSLFNKVNSNDCDTCFAFIFFQRGKRSATYIHIHIQLVKTGWIFMHARKVKIESKR